MNKNPLLLNEIDYLEFMVVKLSNIEKCLINIGVMINATLTDEQRRQWEKQMEILAKKEDNGEL